MASVPPRGDEDNDPPEEFSLDGLDRVFRAQAIACLATGFGQPRFALTRQARIDLFFRGWTHDTIAQAVADAEKLGLVLALTGEFPGEIVLRRGPEFPRQKGGSK